MPTDAKSKAQILKENSTLNPHPERVDDDLFKAHDFFDPRDLLQVKYEMLRRTQVDGWPISRAAESFGFSRPSFYHALEAYQRHGLAGLIPDKPGPREAHKLTPEVMAFVQRHLAISPTTNSPALARQIEQQYGISVHPRSIERALKRKKKKHPKNHPG
jgi:transposase